MTYQLPESLGNNETLFVKATPPPPLTPPWVMIILPTQRASAQNVTNVILCAKKTTKGVVIECHMTAHMATFFVNAGLCCCAASQKASFTGEGSTFLWQLDLWHDFRRTEVVHFCSFGFPARAETLSISAAAPSCRVGGQADHRVKSTRTSDQKVLWHVTGLVGWPRLPPCSPGLGGHPT